MEEEIQGQCDCAFHIMFFIALIDSKILTSVAQNYALLRITRYTFKFKFVVHVIISQSIISINNSSACPNFR